MLAKINVNMKNQAIKISSDPLSYFYWLSETELTSNEEEKYPRTQ